VGGQTSPTTETPVVSESGEVLGSLRHIPITSITPNTFQPRTDFAPEALAELATSIKTMGVLQPIVVRRRGSDSTHPYELIAGERRWRAASLAGLVTIPAVVRDAADREAASIAIAENVQRTDLNPIEVGLALSRLHTQFTMSQSQIADEVGLERPTVANLLRLLDLPESVRDLVAKGALSKGHAKLLLSLNIDTSRSAALAQKCADEGWSIRKLEEEAKRLLQPVTQASTAIAQPAKPVSRFDANLADLERQLSDKLATRVKIKPQKGEKGRTRGRIIISYYDLDHFGGVMRKISGIE
jgi:ParB family chromosome partitioning protein